MRMNMYRYWRCTVISSTSMHATTMDSAALEVYFTIHEYTVLNSSTTVQTVLPSYYYGCIVQSVVLRVVCTMYPDCRCTVPEYSTHVTVPAVL